MATQPISNLVTTWNAAGTTFNAIKMNVTDTASAAGSLLMDLQVGGSSQFKVSKAGKTLAGDGLAYAFVNASNTGIGRTANDLTLYSGATPTARLFSTGFAVSSDNSIGFTSGLVASTTADTILARDAANTLAQRNGVNAQAFRVYKSYTDVSNYSRVALYASGGGNFVLSSEIAGTGTGGIFYISNAGANAIEFQTNTTSRWTISGSNGHFLAGIDNASDIGASGANRPRDVYAAGTIYAGVNLGLSSNNGLLAFGSSFDTILARDAANTVAQRNGTNAQTFRLYNTYTDASNYERAVAAWSGNIFYLGTQAAGTGTGSREIFFFTNGTNRWSIGGSSGHFLAAADATYDIGASGANRPRNLYVAGRANIDGLTVGKGGQTAVSANTALGVSTLSSASLTGNNNTAVGSLALQSVTTGGENTAIGAAAHNSNISGSSNTAVGYQSLYSSTTGANNTAVGLNTLVFFNTSNNTALGYEAIRGSTTVANNTGNNLTSVGYRSLYSNTSGTSNSALGLQALYSNTTGSNNSALGVSALQNNTTADSNVGIGQGALYSATTGGNNTGIGTQALIETTTGARNSAVGHQAIERFVTSNNQTAIGYRALRGGDATPANNTGANNIAIGYQAGDAITTGSTNLVIGYDIDVDSATGSNQVNIADRYFHDRIRLLERTSDPAKPAEGNMIVWMSNGTGLGDDGDVIIASTAGGVTNYAILFDHSAGTLWP